MNGRIVLRSVATGALVSLLAASSANADQVLSDFNGTGFTYTFDNFVQTTGASAVRLSDNIDSWGGGGINTSLDLSAYADGRFVVDMFTNVGNQTDSFMLELIDTSGNHGKWSFNNLTELPTSTLTNLVSSTTLANPTEGNNDWHNLDLSNIRTWNVLGAWGGSVPFDMSFDRVAVSNTVPPPPPYSGAEPDAPWRAEADARIETHRKGDLVYQVTSGGAPVAGAQVHVGMTKHEFGFGAAAQASRLASTSPADDVFKQKVEALFNIVTLPNSLKWPAWEGEWGPNHSQFVAQRALDWLGDRDITRRGHVQVWPSWEHVPSTIRAKIDEYNAPGTTPARQTELENELRQDVLDHITDVASATDGKIAFWDVINEVRVNHDLMDILGDQAMVDWFNASKAASPSSLTFLNEYHILASGGGVNTPNQQEFADTIQYLIDQGAAIDGIGIQSHFNQSLLSGPEEIWAILDRFDDFGLPIQITEFTFGTSDEQLQAQYTADFLKAVFAHPAVDDWVTWVFWDGPTDDSERGMFNGDWSIKPNGEAFVDLVFNQWWTDEQSVSNGLGGGTVRGFKGAHDVRVAHQGITQIHHGVVISDTVNNLQLPLAGTVDGTLAADVINNSGVMEVAGAGSIGTLLLEGDFQQKTLGTLHIELSDIASDQLLAESLTLDGTLIVDVLEGARPGIGEVFTILATTGGLFGTFDDVLCDALILDIQYLANEVRLTVLDYVLPGDLDGNGIVDLADLSMVLNHWDQSPPTESAADIDGNDIVDLADLSLVLNDWDKSLPSASGTSIPEPASVLFLGLGACTLMARRKR